LTNIYVQIFSIQFNEVQCDFYKKKIIKGKNFTIFAVTRQEVLEQLREKREGERGAGGWEVGKGDCTTRYLTSKTTFSLVLISS
jgi:hypothetical protein